MTDRRDEIDHAPWPMRVLILLAGGALTGLAVYFLTAADSDWSGTNDPLRLGVGALLVAAGIAFALSLERLRWLWSAAFALAAGLLVGFVVWWNGDPDHWGSSEGWRLASALLAVAIAIPLFQAARDSGSRRIDPRIAQDHAWTDAVLWGLACAFVLALWLMLQLLGALFGLIGLDFLARLLGKGWVAAPLLGGALGAALGMLRDRDSVLALFQRVGRTILSVLAPVLGAGLVLFVLALPFTGLDPLWRETVQTTPILLGCIIIAVILANAVIGNGPDEEAKVRPLRVAAMALAIVILPLGIVAAVSTGLRIGQYGLTPDRLWGVVAVTVAIAAAAAYLAALAFGRRDWTSRLRRHNVVLAIGICLLATFLALPILNFGAISARDQLGRLESGRVTPEKFDWLAMRFDFGPSGSAALERLARSGNARIAGYARYALALKTPAHGFDPDQPVEQASRAPTEIVVRPAGIAVPPDLRALILRHAHGSNGMCDGPGDCLLFWRPGQRYAIVLLDGCAPRIVGAGNETKPGVNCSIDPTVLTRGENGRWIVVSSNRMDFIDRVAADAAEPRVTPDQERAMLEAQRAAIERGDVEIREVRQHRLFIGGKPEGDDFD